MPRTLAERQVIATEDRKRGKHKKKKKKDKRYVKEVSPSGGHHLVLDGLAVSPGGGHRQVPIRRCSLLRNIAGESRNITSGISVQRLQGVSAPVRAPP